MLSYIKRLRELPKAIELETTRQLKDYFLLTLVIGIGLILSILSFIFTLDVKYDQGKQLYLEQVQAIHRTLAANIHQHDLHFEILVRILTDSDPAKPLDSFSWLQSRIDRSNFDCIYLADINTRNGHVTNWASIFPREKCSLQNLKTSVLSLVQSKEILSGNTYRWDYIPPSNETMLANDELIPYFSLLNRPDRSVERYIFAFLNPIDQVRHMDGMTLPEDVSISMNVMKSSWEPTSYGVREHLAPIGSNFVIEKDIYSASNMVRVTYAVPYDKIGSGLYLPWIVLAVGFTITILLGVIVFELLQRSIHIQTEVEEKTRGLKEATLRAEEANKTKTRFLANVSHEVRTPLNLIMGMAELLSETKLSPEQRHYVQSFKRSGTHLLNLINDILEIAKVESGQLSHVREEFDLIAMVEDIADMVSVGCRSKGLSFDFIVNPEVPRIVYGDPRRIRQIFINLTNNAMKFTHQGGITVRLEASDFDVRSQECMIQISVLDTGPGVPEEAQKSIFQEFYQVDSSSTRHNAGVGLGLSIVKSLVDQMHGKVWLKSSDQTGSEFVIEIPIKFRTAMGWIHMLAKRYPSFKNKKIYLMSESATLREYLTKSFHILNSEIIAYSKLDALVSGLASSTEEPDFLLLDFSLNETPERSFEKYKSLKLSDSLQEKTVIFLSQIHLTSHVQNIKGFDLVSIHYRPVKLEVLLSSLEGDESLSSELFDSRRKSNATQQTPSDEQRVAPLSILLAEDDFDNRALVSAFLKDFPVKIKEAENGKEALESYKSEKEKFDLLITDVQMPVMDGVQLIEQVRDLEKAENLRPLPVIVLTADAQGSQMDELRQYNVDEYLTKPISKARLISVLSHYQTQVSPEL